MLYSKSCQNGLYDYLRTNIILGFFVFFGGGGVVFCCFGFFLKNNIDNVKRDQITRICA